MAPHARDPSRETERPRRPILRRLSLGAMLGGAVIALAALVDLTSDPAAGTPSEGPQGAQSGREDDAERKHRRHREDPTGAAAATPSSSGGASGSASDDATWYVSVHDDGAVDASGNDGLLSFSPDGRPLGDPLGPAPAEIGKVHGLRGMLPLRDGTLLVIAAWKENTAILRYGAPGDVGVRPFVEVFARSGDSNPLLVHPYALAVGPDGAIYASNQDSNTVTRHGAPGTPLAGRPLGSDGSDESGESRAGLVVPSREMSSDAKHRRGIKEVRGIAFGPDGKLYVADRGEGEVSRWDPRTGVREATIASKEHGLATPIQLLFSPDGASLFISDNKVNGVFRVALADGRVSRFIGPDAGLDAPSALALDGGSLLVGSRKGRAILRFDLATGAVGPTPFASGLPDDPEWLVRDDRRATERGGAR